MQCYFDGSGRSRRYRQPVANSGRIHGADSFWGRFRDDWDRMLRERYPVAPYIHMIELLSREDPFAWGAAGWNEQKINKLILGALNILQQVDKREFCSFICSIDTSAHERLLAEGYVIRERS